MDKECVNYGLGKETDQPYSTKTTTWLFVSVLGYVLDKECVNYGLGNDTDSTKTTTCTKSLC